MLSKRMSFFRHLSLAVVAAALMACGDDSGEPKPDAAPPDAGKDVAAAVDAGMKDANASGKADTNAPVDSTVDAPMPSTDTPVGGDASVDGSDDGMESDAMDPTRGETGSQG